MNKIDKQLLEQISGLHEIPQGSFSFRKNGESIATKSTAEIEIVPKLDKNGIDIYVKPATQNKSIHLPVIISQGGVSDVVYNDFYIGEGSNVLIVAGCGIHNSSDKSSQHNGIHTFHLEKNCKVKYIEKHLGTGIESSEKILNPITLIEMKENSQFEMDTTQLGGVTYSNRKTKAVLHKAAKLLIKEKILTSDKQVAKTNFDVVLRGDKSSVEVVSRSVAKDISKQEFVSTIKGKNECFGHVECDGILIDQAIIVSTPKIVAQNPNASLIHEAAIGKIAGDQLVKLQTLGLSEEEAQNEIIKGFLK